MATAGICAIDGCGKNRVSRGWCGMHYMRWWTHGDPNGGIFVKGGAEAFILNVALPYAEEECLKWPFEIGAKGYGRLRRRGRHVFAHGVVCELAHGPKPTSKHQSAHSCGHGHLGCINPKHLRWALPTENEADKVGHGTVARGQRNGNSAISEHTARAILALKGQRTQAAIAEMHGTTRSTVRDIHLGKSWRWLEG